MVEVARVRYPSFCARAGSQGHTDSTQQQIALTLRAEGILLLPPIEWDGRLGLEEQRVLDRRGFLLKAYHVQVFCWELVDLDTQ